MRRLLFGLAALAAISGAFAAAPGTTTTRAGELKLAQGELAVLQERFGDQNPRLAAARLRVAVWQCLAQEDRKEPLILQCAWVERDVMRRR